MLPQFFDISVVLAVRIAVTLEYLTDDFTQKPMRFTARRRVGRFDEAKSLLNAFCDELVIGRLQCALENGKTHDEGRRGIALGLICQCQELVDESELDAHRRPHRQRL